METRRWTNPSQPQTLYMAHLFLYISAAFNLVFSIFNGAPEFVLPRYVLNPDLRLVMHTSWTLIACEVLGGYFIANERKIGWWLGLASVALSLYLPVWVLTQAGPTIIFDVNWIISVAFPLVLLVLLVHPMSRDYQKIWFK